MNGRGGGTCPRCPPPLDPPLPPPPPPPPRTLRQCCFGCWSTTCQWMTWTVANKKAICSTIEWIFVCCLALAPYRIVDPLGTRTSRNHGLITYMISVHSYRYVEPHALLCFAFPRPRLYRLPASTCQLLESQLLLVLSSFPHPYIARN